MTDEQKLDFKYKSHLFAETKREIQLFSLGRLYKDLVRFALRKTSQQKQNILTPNGLNDTRDFYNETLWHCQWRVCGYRLNLIVPDVHFMTKPKPKT